MLVREMLKGLVEHNESVLPLAVNAVAKFEQPARALFLSNGRARSEVAGPGIS